MQIHDVYGITFTVEDKKEFEENFEFDKRFNLYQHKEWMWYIYPFELTFPCTFILDYRGHAGQFYKRKEVK